jgi:hypothetical protein
MDGLFRCAVKSEKPCHNCEHFDIEPLTGLTLNTVLDDGDKDCSTCANNGKPSIFCVHCGPNEQKWRKRYDGDVITEPSHYTQHLPGEVTKDFIRVILNSEITANLDPYQIYCLGAALKYRLRAGMKGDAAEDINKAMQMEKMGGWQD